MSYTVVLSPSFKCVEYYLSYRTDYLNIQLSREFFLIIVIFICQSDFELNYKILSSIKENSREFFLIIVIFICQSDFKL